MIHLLLGCLGPMKEMQYPWPSSPITCGDLCAQYTDLWTKKWFLMGTATHQQKMLPIMGEQLED